MILAPSQPKHKLEVRMIIETIELYCSRAYIIVKLMSLRIYFLKEPLQLMVLYGTRNIL